MAVLVVRLGSLRDLIRVPEIILFLSCNEVVLSKRLQWERLNRRSSFFCLITKRLEAVQQKDGTVLPSPMFVRNDVSSRNPKIVHECCDEPSGAGICCGLIIFGMHADFDSDRLSVGWSGVDCMLIDRKVLYSLSIVHRVVPRNVTLFSLPKVVSFFSNKAAVRSSIGTGAVIRRIVYRDVGGSYEGSLPVRSAFVNQLNVKAQRLPKFPAIHISSPLKNSDVESDYAYHETGASSSIESIFLFDVDDVPVGSRTIMLISLHKQATTTPKIRAAIQASTEPAWQVAERYGISEQTVWKWRRQDSVHGRSPQGKLEQHLDRQAKLVGRIGKQRWPPSPTVT